MELIYGAMFTADQNGGYTVEVPDLPGCITEGDTLTEAIEMGRDAASGWILGEMETDGYIPKPTDYALIKCPKGSFVSLLVLDMDAYAEKYGQKTVRKNITIPAWLNTYGEKNHINFSGVLADSLMEMALK